MNISTRFFIPLIALIAMGFAEARELTLINKTDRSLGVAAVNFPFKRSAIDDVDLHWLQPDEQTTINTRGRRLVGWYQAGVEVSYTVVQRRDSVIAFVDHKGEIKTLHGAPRLQRISNFDQEPIFVTTQNAHEGNIDCKECAEDCYYDEGTLADCDCLEWCWDRTQDMEWFLRPGMRLDVLMAAGTRYDLSESTIEYDDFYDRLYIY